VTETNQAKMAPPMQIPRHNPTMNSVGSIPRGAKLIWLLCVTMITKKVCDAKREAARKVTNVALIELIKRKKFEIDMDNRTYFVTLGIVSKFIAM